MIKVSEPLCVARFKPDDFKKNSILNSSSSLNNMKKIYNNVCKSKTPKRVKFKRIGVPRKY